MAHTSLFSVPIDDIGEDRFFALSEPFQLPERLADSVSRFNVLTPLKLLADPGGAWRIVHGFRRYWAARQAGVTALPALEVAGSDKELFLERLEENASTRPLEELERAAALHRLRHSLDFDEAPLIDEYLPRLGIRPGRSHLRRYLQLHELGDTIKRAVHGGLEVELALRLSRRPPELARFVCALVERYRLGRNKQRECFELLDELSAEASDFAIEELWERWGASEIERGPLTGPDAWSAIADLLRSLRYPSMARHEKRFRELLARLEVPAGLRLQPPRHFEGNALQVSFRVRSPEDLSQAAQRLEAIADSNEAADLFDLI